ncbi:uncharacterized protein EV420DRAFT_1760984 [Desarmillaria tabescens]|uniref:Uncharacterized protein n=1 Tax=Armillaria tabescens TaxID=1929756 RepID=A0AA39NDP9_ARMTA|nr:uncharacterized protein EV420DRAFT_1760984 [Desarmillaria tabescens]KAK0463727.1 hypothetical protein EV420DRAFT_1760984 [Desarmillaria tabescens]
MASHVYSHLTGNGPSQVKRTPRMSEPSYPLRYLCPYPNETAGLSSATVREDPFFPQLVEPLTEDSGLDEDQDLRILDGQEVVPDTDDALETDNQNQPDVPRQYTRLRGARWYLYTRPACRPPPVDVPGLSDPSQL